jgi:hypothetical protein
VGRHGLWAAIAINIAVSMAVLPVTANPYDFALITGTANSWMNWHVPIFLYWKFGADYAALNVAAACGARILSIAGMSVPAAAHVSFKLMLVAGNLTAALALWKLARRFRPSQSGPLTAIWLLSPVVIWVAAYHAQIEPIAAGSTLWALWLISERRWVLAGFITGIGVGFEYIPIVAFVAVFALVISKRETLMAGGMYVISFGVTVALCFAQLLFNHVANLSFRDGLVGQATAHGAAIVLKPGSIWYWSGTVFTKGILEPHWLILLALFAGAASILAASSVRRGTDAAPFAAAGATLLVATVLDPTALPQFGVLALVGLCLIALEFRLPIPLIAGAPLLTLIGYIFSVPFYSYYEDVDPNVSSQLRTLLPQIPTNPKLYSTLSTVALELSIVAIAVWLLGTIRAPRRHSAVGKATSTLPSSTMATSLIEIMVLMVMVVWSVQPPLWSNVIGANPKSTFDSPYLISRRADVRTILTGSSVKATFDPTLLSALRSTNPAPDGVVEFAARPMARQTVAGGSSLPATNQLVIHIPLSRPDPSVLVDRIDIEVLAHNAAWTSIGSVDGRARIDGRIETPRSSQLVVPTWSELVYELPIGWLPASANQLTVSLRLIAQHTVLNANSRSSPWLLAWDSSGKLFIGTNRGNHWVDFLVSPYMQGDIYLSGSEMAGDISVPALPLISQDVSDEAFVWPTPQYGRPDASWQWFVGIGYLVLVIGGLALCVFAFQKDVMYPTEVMYRTEGEKVVSSAKS